MKMKVKLLAGVVSALFASQSMAAVEIEYWQYVFETRVKAMDKLIAEFEAQNPDIKVKHVTFPYADYQTRVVAATMAKKGPDVLQLFYGWTDQFVKGKVLQPLDESAFPADKIEAEFFPIVQAMKRDGKYYGLPTAVRSLALFYNKKLFDEAGVTEPPKTLEELVEVGKKIAKHDAGGNLAVAGLTLDMAGQDHHWWREVLTRQFGGAPYSDDHKQIAYNSPAGQSALQFYTDLQTKEKIGMAGFMDEGQAAFRAGRAGMTIDGTFRLGAFKSIEGFEWGVAELPTKDGIRSNYASYFANGIGSGSKGEKREAAEKFLQFISSPRAMEVWLEGVGELPARREVALTEANLANPIYAPFLKGLEDAHTTIFVDEAAQRQVSLDMSNRVLLKGEAVDKSLQQAADAEQKILNKAYK